MSAPEATSASSQPSSGGDAIAARIVGLLSASLRDWQLPSAQWKRLTTALTPLAEAGPTPDAATLRGALVALQRAAPDRIVPIRTTRTTPAPRQHRERANHLIHTLTPPTPDPPRTPAPPSP
ncbi:CATRA system-associated protein [Streptomyces sp. NPDC004244]|uniref:CATRA system-associated protein n=1 Tax=Streptomyces sp. NPDC101206 TaxID=3366128 RepID=UPI0037FBC7D5